jgi:electron-transferring-flavoprotein dehydrogenase
VIHTLGFPLRFGHKYHEYGGSWIYPMGEDKVSIGFVVGLDYADATVSCRPAPGVQTHPLIRGIPGRRAAPDLGAKTIPGGGLWGLPSRARARRAPVRRRRRLRGHGRAGGVNYAMRSGILAAEAVYGALKAGRADAPAGLWGYDTRVRDSEIWRDLWKVRNIRPAFEGLRLRRNGPPHGHTRRAAAVPKRVHFERTRPCGVRGRPRQGVSGGRRRVHLRQVSSVFASGNRTRDDQRATSACSVVPRELAVTWERMCPAKVYEIGDETGARRRRARPRHRLQLRAVRRDHGQGRAAHAPEGGSGPEYTLT